MFGTDSYITLIKSLKDKGFEFGTFISEVSNKLICLRHDIDFSVQEAHKLALIENQLGIKASYFFMLSSNMYNPLSIVNSRYIKEIKEMGHSISLHYDPTCYTDIQVGFTKEKKIFDNFFNINIEIVSIHRPGKFLNANNQKLNKCMHTYEDRFFKNMNYLSDSGGRDIRQKINNLKISSFSKPLHLLIHPVWWTKYFNEPSETLKEWLMNQQLFLINETKLNCSTFKA